LDNSLSRRLAGLTGPTGPLGPSAPVSPLGPICPGGPSGPITPGGPASPGALEALKPQFDPVALGPLVLSAVEAFSRPEATFSQKRAIRRLGLSSQPPNCQQRFSLPPHSDHLKFHSSSLQTLGRHTFRADVLFDKLAQTNLRV